MDIGLPEPCKPPDGTAHPHSPPALPDSAPSTAQAPAACDEIDTTALQLVFAALPLSLMHITIPRLSRFWRAWAADQPRVQGRSGGDGFCVRDLFVPLWHARERLPALIRVLKDNALHQLYFYLAAAACHDDIAALRWVQAEGLCRFDADAAAAGAAAGALGALCILLDAGCEASRAPGAAAAAGQVGVLRYLAEERMRWPEGWCEFSAWECACAARGGHLAALQFLRQQGAPYDDRTAAAAARDGRSELLRWALADGAPAGARAAMEAVGDSDTGSLECLQILFRHCCEGGSSKGSGIRSSSHGGGGSKDADEPSSVAPFPLGPRALAFAAERGDTAMVQWLLDPRHCTLGPAARCACHAAARRNDVAMLALLRSHGVPWDGDTTSVAAASGGMSALTYAYDSGCLLGDRVCQVAAWAGNAGLLEWALARGASLISDKATGLEDMAHAAAWGGSIPVMRRVFLEEGIPMTADAANAAAESHKVRGAPAAADTPARRLLCSTPPARPRAPFAWRGFALARLLIGTPRVQPHTAAAPSGCAAPPGGCAAPCHQCPVCP
jgi:hypothetical protein